MIAFLLDMTTTWMLKLAVVALRVYNQSLQNTQTDTHCVGRQPRPFHLKPQGHHMAGTDLKERTS